MANIKTTQGNIAKPSLERSGYMRIVQIIVSFLIMSVVLFLTAGRLDWWGAWVYLAIYFFTVLWNGIWMLRHNPDVINERGRITESAKSWDKVLMILYTVLLFVLMATAGLDARFRWSTVPLVLAILGGVGFILNLVLVFWAMAVNTFLSTVVRIQEDRGHQVVTAGPYQYVRHPMYAGNLLGFIAIPLLLGSWWALIPGVMIIVVFVVRTVLEDRTLQAELPGYAEYAQKVRCRLIPGVW